MGDHRMFSNSIVDSDKFLDMPLSTQALYFHLGMRADDDGFVANPKKIVRAVNCTEDNLKLLIAKEFVICFESGIIVITHWNVHNTVRKDRKKDTLFSKEKQLLLLDENKVYTKSEGYVNQLTTSCQPNDNQMTAQGKLSKDKTSQDNIHMSSSDDTPAHFDYQAVVDSFNSICTSLKKVRKLTDDRRRKIRAVGKILGDISFEEYFQRIERSDFLTGRSGNWQADFDFALKPQKTIKIIEGTYDNRETKPVELDYSEEF